MEFSVRNMNIEKFKINFDEKTSLTLNPPKLKVLRKAINIKSAEGENTIDDLVEIVALILSNNKEGRKISTEFVENNFDIGELTVFMEKFVEWVAGIKKNPNF